MSTQEDIRQIEDLMVDAAQTLEGTRLALSLLWIELQCPSQFDNGDLQQVVWATMDSLKSCIAKLGEASGVIERGEW